jgi:hypothetical protein
MSVSASVVNETAPQASMIIAPATSLCCVTFDIGPLPAKDKRRLAMLRDKSERILKSTLNPRLVIFGAAIRVC